MSHQKKPKIFILSTGGTIASAPLSPTEVSGYDTFGFDADGLIESIPGIRERFDLEAEEIFCIDSSEFKDENLLLLSRKANEILERDDIDGLVITHGTDTMEETAFFLNLTVKSQKPLVLTGSMRPTGVLSADGPLNLFNALLTAGEKESEGKGVLVCFADRLFAARDVTKVSTYHTDAFLAAEGGPIGSVIGKVRYYYTTVRPHTATSEFNVAKAESLPKVQIVYTHTACDEVLLKAALDSGCRGIVLAGMGNGSLPEKLRNCLKDRPDKKPVVVRAARVTSGFVSANGICPDKEYDTVPCGTFSPQKARILLQLALTKTEDYDEICDIFDRY